MLFAGWEVHMMKNCDRGLENAARVKVPSISSTVAKYRFNSLGTFCERLKLIADGFLGRLSTGVMTLLTRKSHSETKIFQSTKVT